jgi:hypothetical protein
VTYERREGCRGGCLVARYARSTHPDSINSSIHYPCVKINGTRVPCHTSFAIRAWRAVLRYRLRRLVFESVLSAYFEGGFITYDIEC